MITPGFALVIVGSELLSGRRRDGHMSFAIGLLSRHGLELDRVVYVGDDPRRLTLELELVMSSGDVVFSFGGIGATPDDHTRQCAARAAGVPLERHPEAARIIEERFGADAYPQRIQMAHFPLGARLIPNPVNRIAGFSFGDIHFVPGFPSMAWPMLEWVMDTHYPHLSRAEEAPRELCLSLPGVSEGRLMQVMQEFVSLHPALRLSCLPHMDGDYRETELGVRGVAVDVDAAMRWLRHRLELEGLPFEESDR